MDFSRLESSIGYNFKDKKLLERALTLSSSSELNNEKLECFGDAVLEFIVTEKLYGECGGEKQITVRRKGIVSDEALAKLSVKLGLDGLLIRGKGDVRNKKAVPSAYEALTAAIYLDGGMDAAKKFVLSTVDFTANAGGETDPKSSLQELAQSYGLALPEYSHRELGNAQSPDFIAEVRVFGGVYSGRGASVKSAEKAAAASALGHNPKNNFHL